MGTDKPRVAILMAVYEPRMDWLREQLVSLERQTYPNLKLYIRDDCSPTVPFDQIEACVRECILSFPYEIRRNEENLGSNGTFERLTGEAEGEYFAYCDQDDVWLPEKLEVLQREIGVSGAVLACSDMYIIDGEGKVVADSITKVRKRHRFDSGTGLAEKLVFRNFAAGCTMLVRAEAVKEAIPFCPYMVHDHYIALYCAEKGGIQSVTRPLIRYRIHGENQTDVLAGVKDKDSYRSVRILSMKNRMMWLEENFSCGERTKETIREGLAWMEAREQNWARRGGKRQLWKYRGFNPAHSLFELVTADMPESLFRMCVAMGKRV